mmetsp:Transcript_10610/g.15796  ORF Transcript_10610/g.15796 Transcript_10610/m.15796 type:complete len:90 (+) Transcript_10610:270-539(+)
MKFIHFDAFPGYHAIHRDLKPDNIVFLDNTVKLMDFGLACLVPQSTSSSTYYKMTGDTGTLRYMAPEVATHNPYNEKVDVYSFSLIVWL